MMDNLHKYAELTKALSKYIETSNCPGKVTDISIDEDQHQILLFAVFHTFNSSYCYVTLDVTRQIIDMDINEGIHCIGEKIIESVQDTFDTDNNFLKDKPIFRRLKFKSDKN
jgi:hypothetical protein